MKKILKNFQTLLKNTGGFSFTELAAVGIISGVVMVGATQAVKIYSINAEYLKTLEHIKFSKEALDEYVSRRGVYPCPADPSLGRNDPMYGVSQCRDFTDGAYDETDCGGVATPGNITCVSSFSNDPGDNTDDVAVMIGALPFRTIEERVSQRSPFRAVHRQDGYGNLLTYAVTEHMTNTVQHNRENPINPNTGAINVVDENDLNVVTPEGSAHFVIFSHGDNGFGGYTTNGSLIENCIVPSISFGGDPMDPDGPPPEGFRPGGSTIETEVENCDNNDAIFVQGIRSLGDNRWYNDDILSYVSHNFAEIWKRSFFAPPGEAYIYNTNIGNVGVGTTEPTHKMHVMGSMQAEKSVSSKGYCQGVDDTKCLDPEAIAGELNEMACVDGDGNPIRNRVAYAIHENKMVCRDISWVHPSNVSCPDDLNVVVSGVPTIQDTHLVGFSNTGRIRCCVTDPALMANNTVPIDEKCVSLP